MLPPVPVNPLGEATRVADDLETRSLRFVEREKELYNAIVAAAANAIVNDRELTTAAGKRAYAIVLEQYKGQLPDQMILRLVQAAVDNERQRRHEAKHKLGPSGLYKQPVVS